ncbi:hypothetical protein ACF09E_12170 [Streptomyces sp. NPDC014891]|uniref:hypothetical protein n=1 Tax=Streptomyces sp. NPDC014891 TaxID=3364929 RepID=UPI0036FD813A
MWKLEQVNISLQRKARVRKLVNIVRVLVVATVALSVYLMVAGMVAGGVTLLVMMGIAWAVSEMVLRKADS